MTAVHYPDGDAENESEDGLDVTPADTAVRTAMQARAAHCKCGARMTWCVTEAGKRQPVNTDPDPSGNLIVELHAGTLRSRVDQGLLEVEPAPADRYMPHHATCPAASEFRRPR